MGAFVYMYLYIQWTTGLKTFSQPLYLLDITENVQPQFNAKNVSYGSDLNVNFISH